MVARAERRSRMYSIEGLEEGPAGTLWDGGTVRRGPAGVSRIAHSAGAFWQRLVSHAQVSAAVLGAGGHGSARDRESFRRTVHCESTARHCGTPVFPIASTGTPGHLRSRSGSCGASWRDQCAEKTRRYGDTVSGG